VREIGLSRRFGNLRGGGRWASGSGLVRLGCGEERTQPRGGMLVPTRGWFEEEGWCEPSHSVVEVAAWWWVGLRGGLLAAAAVGGDATRGQHGQG